jgi:hypothetical protein
LLSKKNGRIPYSFLPSLVICTTSYESHTFFHEFVD